MYQTASEPMQTVFIRHSPTFAPTFSPTQSPSPRPATVPARDWDFPPAAPALFQAADFRAFLRDRYSELHTRDEAFSYRYIGGRIGLDSGSVSRVLNQKRKISFETASRLAEAFGLAGREIPVFRALVLYGQSESEGEREFHGERLSEEKARAAGRFMG